MLLRDNRKSIHKDNKLYMWLNSFAYSSTIIGVILLLLGLIFTEIILLIIGAVFVLFPFTCAFIFALICGIISLLISTWEILTYILCKIYKWDI